jgi:hypothetical protein
MKWNKRGLMEPVLSWANDPGAEAEFVLYRPLARPSWLFLSEKLYYVHDFRLKAQLFSIGHGPWYVACNHTAYLISDWNNYRTGAFHLATATRVWSSQWSAIMRACSVVEGDMSERAIRSTARGWRRLNDGRGTTNGAYILLSWYFIFALNHDK